LNWKKKSLLVGVILSIINKNLEGYIAKTSECAKSYNPINYEIYFLNLYANPYIHIQFRFSGYSRFFVVKV
jgi:hypothetical protein